MESKEKEASEKTKIGLAQKLYKKGNSVGDIADILEALPYDERLALWHLVDNNERGAVFEQYCVGDVHIMVTNQTYVVM